MSAGDISEHTLTRSLGAQGSKMERYLRPLTGRSLPKSGSKYLLMGDETQITTPRMSSETSLDKSSKISLGHGAIRGKVTGLPPLKKTPIPRLSSLELTQTKVDQKDKAIGRNRAATIASCKTEKNEQCEKHDASSSVARRKALCSNSDDDEAYQQLETFVIVSRLKEFDLL